uniref:IPT/TIG domain-containing protein n=1 Tax=Solibacter usitatus (strain Ellin6076) TaxID=234267 RepID=Q024K6_SOLUE
MSPTPRVFLGLLLASGLSAQFHGLSSTADGTSVYFASTLRLKGAPPLLNGKIFVARQDGVSLYRARERTAPPANSPACTVGGFSDYLGAETAANGVVALAYGSSGVGGCSYPPNASFTQITTASGDTSVPGIARLSPNGRYALVYLAATSRPGSAFALSILDVQSGAQTPIAVPAPPFPQYVSMPPADARVIANDGTAILGVTDGSTKNSGYLLKPSAGAQSFPVADGLPLIIDADAAKVLYQRQGGLYLFDLHTSGSTLLMSAAQSASGFRMSDDARRLLYIGDGQVHLLDTTTLVDRALTNDAAKVAEATISGDGKVVYAVTVVGRLLKIDVASGAAIEVIGRTPYLSAFGRSFLPGLTATVSASGLSDTVINGTVPLNDWLGNVTMWIGDRKVPVIQLTPSSVSILVPWNVQLGGGPIRILAEAPGDHTPFYFPEAEATVEADGPRAGAIARQDWQPTYSGPVNTGEIIHVYAVGFGPVAPEVPDGAAAPAAEPLARLTQSLTCSNAEILYAGLAPYAVERVYQLDIRIGPTPGYQKFTCTLGNGARFVFLTLNVVQ